MVEQKERTNKDKEEEILDLPKYTFISKFLNVYDLTGIIISNPSLRKYINIDKATLNSGRNHSSKLQKLGINIIERFLCCLMRTEKNTGKKVKMYKILKKCFDIINEKTSISPVQVLIQAIENSAPTMEQIRFGRNTNLQRSAEISPSRRLSIAIRNLASSVFKKVPSTIPLYKRLAKEIIDASKGSSSSTSVFRRQDTERIALLVR